LIVYLITSVEKIVFLPQFVLFICEINMPSVLWHC